MINKKLLFYDFEVFKYLWLIVLIDYQTKEKIEIVNNVDELTNTYNQYKDYIWVGYNSRGYDQFILKGLLTGYDPYEINNEIINNGKKGHQVVQNAWRTKLYNYDVMLKGYSLKQLEGYMGSNIKETSVPFDLDRPLTDDEIKETLLYCTHDVKETINVFDNQQHEFDSQLSMIEAFDLDMRNFTKTKSQLSAIVLESKKQPFRNDEFDLRFPDTLKIETYPEVLEWYKNQDNMNYKKSLIKNIAGVEHIFAWGGLHGAIPNYSYEGIILCCDVASLYPALMIEYDYLSRNVKHVGKYKEIRDKRMVLKKEKNPMQEPFKIVLNGTYGSMKFMYSDLYDPLMANNVCVAGQLLLLDLIEKLEPYCDVIQSNTDGVFLKVNKREDIPLLKTIAREWEIRTRLDLEWDEYTKIYQKDVNNYIIIDENGEYKSKGSYVKKLSPIDYDLPIVNKALKKYFINSIPIEDTINKETKLIEFQRVVKSSGKFKGMYHGESEDRKLSEKVVRIFASKHEEDRGLFKLKEGTFHKVENTPDKCFINNEEIRDELIEDHPHLNKQYYIDTTKERVLAYTEQRNDASHLTSGIKGVNLKTLRILDELIKNTEETDLLKLLYSLKSLKNKSNVKILIKLGYFTKFGSIELLEKIYKIFEFLKFGEAKQLHVLKLEHLDDFLVNMISRNSSRTPKMYTNLNVEKILSELIEFLNVGGVDTKYSKYDLFNFQITYCPRKLNFKTKQNDDRTTLYLLSSTSISDRCGDTIKYLFKGRSLGSGKESPIIISKELSDKFEIKKGMFIKMLNGGYNKDGYYQIYNCNVIQAGRT